MTELHVAVSVNSGLMGETRKEFVQFLNANVGVRGKDWSMTKPNNGWGAHTTIRMNKTDGAALLKLAFGDRYTIKTV